jgi:hypothetical protein
VLVPGPLWFADYAAVLNWRTLVNAGTAACGSIVIIVMATCASSLTAAALVRANGQVSSCDSSASPTKRTLAAAVGHAERE